MKKRLRWNTEIFLPNIYINLRSKNISTIWQEMSPPTKESNIQGNLLELFISTIIRTFMSNKLYRDTSKNLTAQLENSVLKFLKRQLLRHQRY